VQGKKQAAETYDDALASGHGGFLLQEVRVPVAVCVSIAFHSSTDHTQIQPIQPKQDNEMKDVFSLRVGNLPPGASATVRMTYVAQIDEEVPEETGGNSTLRFVLPTAVAPRYAPASDQPPELYQHAEALLAKWPKDLLKIKGKLTAASPILGLVPHTFKEEAALELEGGNTASFSLAASHLGTLRRIGCISIHRYHYIISPSHHTTISTKNRRGFCSQLHAPRPAPRPRVGRQGHGRRHRHGRAAPGAARRHAE
jgi:hypothetical protein